MIKKALEIDVAHKRVTGDLRRWLRDGRWSSGEMLPGRRDLAKEYGVSVATIERAILPLMTEGLFRSDGRRGTFVARLPNVHEAPTDSSIPAKLHGVHTGTIGIVASFGHNFMTCFNQSNYTNMTITDALERHFTDSSHTSVVIDRVPIGNEVPAPLYETFEATLDQALKGIVVLCFDTEPGVVDAALEKLDGYQLPVVCISSAELARPIPHVVNDDFRAGYLAGQHVLRAGHEQITVVCPFRAQWSEERLLGVRSAVAHRGLCDDAVRILRGDDKPWAFMGPQFPATQSAIRMAADDGWKFEGAIVAIQDIVGFGIIYEGLTQKRLPGRDYALIGFDDHPTARLCGITTMRPPLHAMAREASRLLMLAIAGNQSGMVSKMQAELVVRSSTTAGGRDHLTLDDYGKILSYEFGYKWDSDRKQGVMPENAYTRSTPL